MKKAIGNGTTCRGCQLPHSMWPPQENRKIKKKIIRSLKKEFRRKTKAEHDQKTYLVPRKSYICYKSNKNIYNQN